MWRVAADDELQAQLIEARQRQLDEEEAAIREERREMEDLLGAIRVRREQARMRIEDELSRQRGEERQRREELRRREKQKREEQLRKEEKRLMATKLQCEELRGPLLVTCCVTQDHLMDHFDRKALHIALGSRGYVCLWESRLCHYGVPKQLDSKLATLKGLSSGAATEPADLGHPNLVALGPDSDYYFIQYPDGKQHWDGPTGFTEALNERTKPCSVVVFGPRSSWFIRWCDGIYQYRGLPQSLDEVIMTNRHRSVAALSISGIDSELDDNMDFLDLCQERSVDDAAWFLRWEDADHPQWLLNGGPEALNAKVSEVICGAGTIRSVEFGAKYHWLLRYSD